jgi:hypothetical protein
MAEKKSNNLGNALATFAMGMGQGITGQPYLTNFQNMQMKQREMAKEQESREAFNAALNAGQLNGSGDQPQFIKVPDPSSPTGFKVEIDPRWSAGIESQKQSDIAVKKENEVAISKSNRLKTVGKTIENAWLKTSPYKGAITKTGLVPLLGAWDVIKKGMGATNAQQQDQAYASFVQGVRAQLARGMGDVGNLSEYEQRAVVQLVPSLMDSYESGNLKLGQLAQLVEDIKTTRGGKSGSSMETFDVNGIKYNIPKDKVDAFKAAKGIK